MLPNIESPPEPVARRLADATDQPSPGPWVADRLHQTECGAVRILDNRGNTIGGATDTMGHTLDPAVPVGIHPNDIVLNAILMALGPDAVMLARTIRGAIITRDREGGWRAGDPLFETAFDMATGILRRAGALHDVP